MNEIMNTIFHINSAVEEYSSRFSAFPKEFWEAKPSPAKWSKKEILGHLIDSAHVNTDRMIRTQIEDSPTITYPQDDWVKVSKYQDIDINTLIEWWVHLNKRLTKIAEHCSPENFNKKCRWGDNEEVPLSLVFVDYYRHLRHHLNQIVP